MSEPARKQEPEQAPDGAGYASPVNTPRGRDIMAACGQLKSKSVKQRASKRLAQLDSQELARMPC